MNAFDKYKDFPYINELWVKGEEIYLVQVKDAIKVTKGDAEAPQKKDTEIKPKKLKQDGTK